MAYLLKAQIALFAHGRRPTKVDSKSIEPLI